VPRVPCAVFAAAAIVLRRPVANEREATSLELLTPLAVTLGQLLRFLASRVRTNLDRTNDHIAHEASALRGAILFAHALRRLFGPGCEGT
jgi:hypothetical protein